jgi:signal peptidase I
VTEVRGGRPIDSSAEVEGLDGVHGVHDGDLELPDEHHRRRNRSRVVVEWIVVIVVALLVAQLIKTYVLQQFSIPSESMAPTLRTGDRVFVNKLSYRLHDVNRGDVVVFERPEALTDPRTKDLIKRVIGLPGETLEFRPDDCQVLVEGRVLEEPYLAPGQCTSAPGTTIDPEQDRVVVVPEDSVFVMGDNRSNSTDSRVFGPIEEDTIVGRAFFIIWPVGDWAWL